MLNSLIIFTMTRYSSSSHFGEGLKCIISGHQFHFSKIIICIDTKNSERNQCTKTFSVPCSYHLFRTII